MASIGAGGSTDVTTQPQPRRDLALAPIGGDYGTYGQSGKRELSFALIWRVAVEWRWLILATVGVGIAAAILITLLTPLKYRSSTVLELNPPQVEVLDQTQGGSNQNTSPSDMNFIGTQLGLLGSRALAQRVVQDLNLASKPEVVGDGTDRQANTSIATSYVQGGLSAQIQPQSSLVKLSFVSRDPQLAANIVNGAAEAYINTTLERRYQSSSYARDFLQKQIAITRRALEKSERELVAYAQKQRIVTTAGGTDQGGSDTTSLTGESLIALNSALAQAQARRYAAQEQYRTAMSGGPSSEVGQNTAGLRAQLAGLTAQYNQKLKLFRPDYPEMQQLKAQMDSLQASIKAEARTVNADRLGTLRAAYQSALAEEHQLQARVSNLTGSVLDLRGRRIRYTILQRDVDTNRTLYDALLQRYKQIGVAGGIGSANASIVDRGDPPGGAFSPNLYLNLLLGTVLGLAAGLGAAILLEFINDTIKSPDDVRDKLGLPFLGGIPSAKTKPIDELRDALSPVTEAYLSTATALQFITEGGAPKTMLVTSTRPAEGKSTSAWALAQSYTRLGRTVLLIDADMRRPAFVTGQDDIGLSHILTNTSTLTDNVLRTDVENLWMMPSGPIPPSPPELLASPRFASLLAEAAASFDHVVIDGPPILGLADAPLLSSTVQGTMMVIESGRTRTRPAVEAMNRLKTAGSHVIGAILTRYQPQAAYGYGYGYGYGRSKEAYRYVADDSDKRRRILLSVTREG